jgi:hypothetical protein
MERSISMQLALARTLRVPAIVARYITSQRDRFSPQAVPLNEAQTSAMSGFFSPPLLKAVRTVVLDGVRLKNPPFRGTLKRLGFSDFRDLSQICAITFDHVVVSHESFTDVLLFHELVHVEQYRQLGIRRFSELYVRGFLVGGGYDGIPLEVNAYELCERFEANPREQFSVAQVVEQWIRDGKFWSSPAHR